MGERTKVIIIAGPTASSKSEIALKLALDIKGEIINADSIQIYKYFDIGSAKPSLEMREKVPHHLIDILEPDEDFNAYKFKELARQKVSEILARGKIPIVVGGTGLYIRIFLYDLFVQDEDKILKERQRLEELYKSEGLGNLYALLKEVDPKASSKIHPNDKVRILRALEFFYATGIPISEQHQRYNFTNSIYDFKIFIPDFSKEEIARRIENRTKKIFELGIVEEVKKILDMGYDKNIKPLKSIGYKEALQVLEGKLTVEEAIKETIKNTKAYAKRQKIWFKKEREVEFIPMKEDNLNNFFERIKLFLHKN